MDVIFGNAARCEPDSQWRIPIPRILWTMRGSHPGHRQVGNTTSVKIWDA